MKFLKYFTGVSFMLVSVSYLAVAAQPNWTRIISTDSDDKYLIHVTQPKEDRIQFELCRKDNPQKCTVIGGKSYSIDTVNYVLGELEGNIQQMSRADYVKVLVAISMGSLLAMEPAANYLPKVSFRYFGELYIYRAIGLGAATGAAVVGGAVYYARWSDIQKNWINLFESLSMKSRGVQKYKGDIKELADDLEALLIAMDRTWS